MFAAARRAPAVGVAHPREVVSSPAPVQSLDPNIPPPPPLAEGSQRRASSVPSGVPRGTFIQSVLAMARGRPSGPVEVLKQCSAHFDPNGRVELSNRLCLGKIVTERGATW